MIREEILKQGAPIEPNCLETDREELYKVGLRDGATASHWHKVVDGDLPTSYVRCLLANHKGMCVGYMLDNEGIILDSGNSFASTIDEVDYWMEIPELPE